MNLVNSFLTYILHHTSVSSCLERPPKKLAKVKKPTWHALRWTTLFGLCSPERSGRDFMQLRLPRKKTRYICENLEESQRRLEFICHQMLDSEPRIARVTDETHETHRSSCSCSCSGVGAIEKRRDRTFFTGSYRRIVDNLIETWVQVQILVNSRLKKMQRHSSN